MGCLTVCCSLGLFIQSKTFILHLCTKFLPYPCMEIMEVNSAKKPGHNVKLKDAWTQLRNYALALGLPADEAQDLVQNALIKTLDAFDPAKGEFIHLAKKVLHNLARNYWRDYKRDGGVDPDTLPDPGDGFDWMTEESQMEELEAIMNELDSAEQSFLKTLGELLQETEGRMVLEAARKCGLTPDEGWNMMRKIQRKARKVRARLAQPPAPAASAVMFDLPPRDAELSMRVEESHAQPLERFQDVNDLAVLLALKQGFESFHRSLPADAIRRLEFIL